MAKANVDIGVLDETMIELPEVREGGMSGRNEQRKLGTTHGSPRRSRTAKASRISRHAVKSRCAHEWDGWGRLSDDGSGHYNPDLSEGPWGGGGDLPPVLKLSHSGAPPERACNKKTSATRHCKAMFSPNNALLIIIAGNIAAGLF